MIDTAEMIEVRQSMRSLIAEFSKTVDEKARQATVANSDAIKKELQVVADQFAKRYSDLQSKYMDLMFMQDLQGMAGMDRAELFAKFLMAGKAEEN